MRTNFVGAAFVGVLDLAVSTAAADDQGTEISFGPTARRASRAGRMSMEFARQRQRRLHDPQCAQPHAAVFLPTKDKATGAAVVIVPGGGHQLRFG